MAASRSQILSRRLALASLGTAVAVGVVCAVGLFSLGNASALAHVAVTRQLELADEATAMSAFLYQKGFVAEYLLTGNRSWLADLETSLNDVTRKLVTLSIERGEVRDRLAVLMKSITIE